MNKISVAHEAEPVLGRLTIGMGGGQFEAVGHDDREDGRWTSP
jgi:hypothetical protein